MLMTRSNEQLMLESKTQHLRIFIISRSLGAVETVVIHVLISQAHQIAQVWKKKHKWERTIFSQSAKRVPISKIVLALQQLSNFRRLE